MDWTLFTIGHSGVWASAKSDNSVTLASGSSATVTVTVDIPSDQPVQSHQ